MAWQVTRDLDDPKMIKEVDGYDEEDAIDEYCRENFSDWDYPKEMKVYLRGLDVGAEWIEFNVDVEIIPSFTVWKE